MDRISLQWPTPRGFPPLFIAVSVLSVGLVLALTAPMMEVTWERLLNSVGRMADFLRHLFVMPDWSYVPQLAGKLWETIEIVLLGTFIASVLSFPMAILAARNATPHPIVHRVTRDVLSLMRALPELVWALVFVSAVGLGALPGILALAFVTVGFMGKLLAECVEVVGEKAVEGVEAHGASGLQVTRFALIPQAMPDFVATLLYILDHNLRAAAILGLVGAGGIGYDMVMASRLFDYSRLILIFIAMYVVVTLFDRVSSAIRSRII